MADVSEKPETKRRAVARGGVCMQPETIDLITGTASPKAMPP